MDSCFFYQNIHKSFLELSSKEFSEKDLKFLKKLKRLNINSIYDTLYYFPRAYDDRTNIKTISSLSNNEDSVVRARLCSIAPSFSPTKKKMIRATVSDDTGFMEIIWFSAPYVLKTLTVGEEYYFIGVAKSNYGFQMINPEYKFVSAGFKGEILPIYSSVKEISQTLLRKQIQNFLLKYSKLFIENIPEKILKKYNLMNRLTALKEIHFPTSSKNLEEAKRRFAVEELLLLELGILSSRYNSDILNTSIYQLEDKKEFVKKFLSTLPFSLTLSQKKVITEIHKQLSSGKIVNQLIQGDVGSGKTIVSMILLLYMAENSYQGVIMAPTEILATQHFLSHREEFEALGLKVELLVGSLTPKKKREVCERIKSGESNIIIGTHSLIQESVVFKKLGLIVIDEQHKFGVEQRKLIRDKGILANLLVMSATPIPRSLALSIYGDLDLSIINELPPGRKPIKTKHISSHEDKERMYEFIKKKLLEGRQAYFIAPLIEDSEKLSAKSVYELEDEISTYLSQFRIGILHGKMSTKEKDAVMHDFKNKNLDLIISTTVIEVGVNVPNASVIVIDSSDRFGLSSLHQLRGRVGRGEHQSYCFLICNSQNETSAMRMKIMESTNDGFEIAEEDLKLRKPGEIFGTKQSGVTDFKFVDIIHDIKTIKLVRDESLAYLAKNKGKIVELPLSEDIKFKFNIISN